MKTQNLLLKLVVTILIILNITVMIFNTPVLANTLCGVFSEYGTDFCLTRVYGISSLESEQIWVQKGTKSIEINPNGVFTSNGYFVANEVNAQDYFSVGIDQQRGYTGVITINGYIIQIKGGIIVGVNKIRRDYSGF